MAFNKLIISGRLPSRNDAEKAARAHWSKGAKMKAEYTDLVHWSALAARIKPVIGIADITVVFYEPNARRDADNVIGGGLKYIFDGLVAAGIIKDDSQKYVNLKSVAVKVDKLNPRIEIEITGVAK